MIIPSLVYGIVAMRHPPITHLHRPIRRVSLYVYRSWRVRRHFNTVAAAAPPPPATSALPSTPPSTHPKLNRRVDCRIAS
jgi:hypothetical protein